MTHIPLAYLTNLHQGNNVEVLLVEPVVDRPMFYLSAKALLVFTELLEVV